VGVKTIVHITCDFPDPLISAKTKSVKNLLDATPGYRHVVYSLNRVTGYDGVAPIVFGEDRTALAYGAPPLGLFLVTRLEQVADWILADIRARQLSVDALHLHKFSVEGIIGAKLSKALGCPYICNIWGDTDLRITRARRDLTTRWKAIEAGAAATVVCAPWTIDKFEALFGIDRSKALVLPPIVFHEQFHASAVVEAPRLMTLMHLNSHRRKNFAGLVEALATLAGEQPGIHLDVFGAGSPKAVFQMRDIIRKAAAERLVTLKGPLDDARFEETFGSYAAFVMPTRRETFGMVFVEALFAGLPVLHSKGWGIDGSFDDDVIGYGCDPFDQADVVKGVRHLLANQARLKASLAAFNDAGGFAPFKRDAIVAAYRTLLDRTLGVA
jgi:glycosyltransferase involved in cell wall biosynthesis